MIKLAYHLADSIGWALCELAFRARCRGPFVYAYRAGCWFYGKGTDLGLRCGELVPNPKFGEAVSSGPDQPQYVSRKEMKSQ